MSQGSPLPPLLKSPPFRAIKPDLLDISLDTMFLDTSSVPPDDFSNKWGSADTEEALTLYGFDDARLKDCIIAASALVWGVLAMQPAQLEACYRLLHPHLPNLLMVVHRTGGERLTYSICSR